MEPIPLRPRRDGWTPERQAAFVAALAAGRSIAAAAAAAGMSRQAAYRLRRRSAVVAAAWRGPPSIGDGDLDAALDAGLAKRDAAFDAAEAAYRGGADVWLMRQLRAVDRRAQRRAAAAERRAAAGSAGEKAGRRVTLCNLPTRADHRGPRRGGDGRFVAENTVAT